MTFSENDETTFLKNYDITKFDRPSVATDSVVLTLNKNSTSNYRKNSEFSIKLLLIKRGEHPFINMWALPGGFLRKDETVEECAIREIKEETGLTAKKLKYVGVFSDLNRDVRGRVVSNSFISIIDKIQPVKGGFDANDAAWFDVEFNIENNFITINLFNDETQLATVLQFKADNITGTSYEIIRNDGLAFDHGKIIASAIMLLVNSAKNFDLIFDFLPEKFTLSEIQKLYELLINKTVTAPNFRRKIFDYVIETNETTSGNGHRPAKLYKRKL